MPTIRFNKLGAVSGLPRFLNSGDSLSFDLIGDDLDVTASSDSELSLRASRPTFISAGKITFGFGGDTITINATSLNSYTVDLALNSLDAVRTAGGVRVLDRNYGFEVIFNSVGARDPFTISHSAEGSLSGRCKTLNAGGASVVATFFLDFSIRTLAKTTSASNIAAASASITTVATGDVSTAQVQKLTLTKRPDSGKLRLDFDGTLSGWFNENTSGYDLKTLLDAVSDGAFEVDRRDYGEAVEWLITRKTVGVFAALTLTDTLTGPFGVAMSLDLSTLGDGLLSLGSFDSMPCVLVYSFDGVTRFRAPVKLLSGLSAQGTVV